MRGQFQLLTRNALPVGSDSLSSILQLSSPELGHLVLLKLSVLINEHTLSSAV